MVSFFFSSRRRHTRWNCDWSSDVCSSDLDAAGVLLAGGIPVPLYPPARLATIEDHMTRHIGILKSAGASVMVTISEAKALAWLLRARVESLRAVLVPADFSGSAAGFTPVRGAGGQIGFLQYTSGSTGSPKGVVLSHANLLANVRAMGRAARATTEDVFVSWLPLYHDMGLIGGCFATMYLGFPVVLMSPLAFLSRPSQWLRAIHRHRGTISGGPNFSYELCLRRIPEPELEALDLASWRFALNGRGPSSTTGYYRNPEATKGLFDGEWVNTGDRAYLSEGNLYLTGREKDVIIRGGRNISPYALEEAVGDLAGIRRGCVAIFGSMDAASGTERVVVLAETREADPSRHAAIKRKINELAVSLIGAPVDDIMLAPPHTVPKTSSGKIRRLAARDYYERGPSAVKSHAVWWQFVRLAVGSVLPQLRRGWRVARGIAFAAYAWLLFGLMFLAIFAGGAISPG